jgi:formylmethanofuran dehydrogenase subunit E
MTGCTFGKGNLIFRDLGKHVFLFSKRGEPQSLRIALRYGVLDRDAAKTLLDMPDDMLYKIDRIEVEPPSPARIYPTIQCSIYGEGVMEPRARVKDGKLVCLECAEN